MWLDLGGTGEFDVDIGAVVEFSDQGQIKLIDDEGDVSVYCLGVCLFYCCKRISKYYSPN